MITPPWYQDEVETFAFNTYCYHSQEVEDVISLIGNGIVSMDCDTYMTDDDMRYIEEEVQKRYGMIVHIS